MKLKCFLANIRKERRGTIATWPQRTNSTAEETKAVRVGPCAKYQRLGNSERTYHTNKEIGCLWSESLDSLPPQC